MHFTCMADVLLMTLMEHVIGNIIEKTAAVDNVTNSIIVRTRLQAYYMYKVVRDIKIMKK